MIKNLLAVSEPVGIVSEGENLAPVSEPVEESGGEDGITEEFSPAIEALVGGNDDGGILVELRDELEEEVGLEPANGEVAQLVNKHTPIKLIIGVIPLPTIASIFAV